MALFCLLNLSLHSFLSARIHDFDVAGDTTVFCVVVFVLHLCLFMGNVAYCSL